MHKFFLGLSLLSVPDSTVVLAYSATEQEQQSYTRDVQRFTQADVSSFARLSLGQVRSLD
jgi:hypothetical protein